MKRSIFVSAPLILLVGCANGNVEYYEAVSKMNEQRAQVQIAQAQAETERVKALQTIAYSGDDSSRTAAVMALTFAGMSNDESSDESTIVKPQQPESNGDIALRWASVLVPSLTNLYGINRNAAIQQQQIAANRDTKIHDNETMLGFGRLTAGQEAPIVGGQEDVLLYPRNPADEAIVGTEDDVLLLPQGQ